MALDPSTLLQRTTGKYTLEELIGSGTFAWVFRATGPEGERVAVKVLRPRYSGDPQFETRFRNEFEVARGIAHPNIVRIIDVGTEAELTYFVMDFCDLSLEQRLTNTGPLNEPELLAVATQMADALGFAHASGVIHRDIKPDNILFDSRGHAILADFGIARVISGFVAATGANMTIGTPHYISPEQAQGKTVDGRADLYSLGVTLYRAVTGELPFRSTDWFELARMHVEDPPKKPRALSAEISERMERIILKLMAKHPDDRYSSAEQLMTDLQEVQRTSRATASFGSGTSGSLPPVASPRRWTARLGAVLLILAVAALVVVMGSR